MFQSHATRVLTLALLLCPVLAPDARAQLLFEDQGVELHGTVRLELSEAGTCNVLESDTAYEEKQANHGAPMDIWRLDFSVRNDSGRWLNHLIARFQIESEWPYCTNWGVLIGFQLPPDIERADSIGHIQVSGRNVVSPGQTLTETRLFIVLRGDPGPRFSNWSMDFDFAGAPGRAPARADARAPGMVFRDCDACPEMVVLPGGGLALGRYEVTVGEYRAFASATGGGVVGCIGGDSWRNPGFPQTDRHPVTCVSWDDAQEYVSWLSRTAGATYRLPTEAEWERAAAAVNGHSYFPYLRSCAIARTGNSGTCPVGSHGPNAAGLSDMVGNLWEWTEECWEGDCGPRVLRGGSWFNRAERLHSGARLWFGTDGRAYTFGFRVARTLGAP